MIMKHQPWYWCHLLAFQDLSKTEDLPDGIEINRRLKMYANAMARVVLEEKYFLLMFSLPVLNGFR